MENTTEITDAIETLIGSATSLRDFYEELYEESIDEFDTSCESSVSLKSDLWRKITSLQEMAEGLKTIQEEQGDSTGRSWEFRRHGDRWKMVSDSTPPLEELADEPQSFKTR